MSEYTFKPCPICGKEDFKDTQHMFDHIDRHNQQDPEYEKSAVKELDIRKRRVFG